MESGISTRKPTPLSAHLLAGKGEAAPRFARGHGGHAEILHDDLGPRATIRGRYTARLAQVEEKTKRSGTLLGGSIAILLLGLAGIYLLMPDENDAAVAPLTFDAPNESSPVPQTQEAQERQETSAESVISPEDQAPLRRLMMAEENANAQTAEAAPQEITSAAPVRTAEKLQTEPAPVAAAKNSPINANADKFVVQLLAARERKAAEEQRTLAQQRYGSLLNGHSLIIETTDLGEKGIFHRLRVSGFAAREEANALCASLKSRGGDCITLAR